VQVIPISARYAAVAVVRELKFVPDLIAPDGLRTDGAGRAESRPIKQMIRFSSGQRPTPETMTGELAQRGSLDHRAAPPDAPRSEAKALDRAP
jgi:hypothetical protein